VHIFKYANNKTRELGTQYSIIVVLRLDVFLCLTMISQIHIAYTASNAKAILTDDSEITWKEDITTYFNLLPQELPVGSSGTG
jgi:hypothetical protein